MRISPEWAFGEVAVGIGRISLAGIGVGQRLFRGSTGVLTKGGRREEQPCSKDSRQASSDHRFSPRSLPARAVDAPKKGHEADESRSLDWDIQRLWVEQTLFWRSCPLENARYRIILPVDRHERGASSGSSLRVEIAVTKTRRARAWRRSLELVADQTLDPGEFHGCIREIFAQGRPDEYREQRG